jgi:hypothetical protein
MSKSRTVLPKPNKGGRPATGRDPVTAIRLSEEFRAAVDKWAAKQDDKPPRSEAIRRLVESGLKPPQLIKPSETQKTESDRPQGKYDVPPGWGHDELSKFWDAARQNQIATFVRKGPAYSKLARIDQLFCAVSKDWLNPSDEIAALLLLRTHSAFRTAAGLAAAGQAAEAYVLNRSVLENSAYALHLNKNPTMRKVWLNRHVDAASLEACVNSLSYRKVQKTVTQVNRAAGELLEKLYRQTIDFGGHPNERSVTGNMKMQKQQDRRVMLAIMQHGDGLQLDAILKATARCGLCSLEILQGVFNPRFELLGINAAMLELRREL